MNNNKSQTLNNITVSFGKIETFDKHYLISILFLLNKVKELQGEPQKVVYYTLPIVMLAVSFLEAFINHLYYYINEQHLCKEDFEEINRNVISDLYKDFKIEKASILDKYYYLLKYCKNENIKSRHEYKLAKKVVDLRNFLVHSKPYTVNSEILEEDDKIVDILKGQFDVEIIPTTVNKRWQNYLNYNGACWVFYATVEFFGYFWHRLLPTKTTPYYDLLNQTMKIHKKPLKPKKYIHKVIKDAFVIQK